VKKTLALLIASLLLISLLPGLGSGTARAGDTIYWGEEHSAVYDQIHPYTLNWTGDVLDRGGLNLTSMKYESKSASADIVINQYGDIGALSIRKLSGEALSDPTPRSTSGFSNSLRLEQGAVYQVVLHDTSYAKIRIDQIFPDNGFSITKIKFSYVFEAPEPPAAGGGLGSGSAGLDIGSPTIDLLDPAEIYVFEGEGAITIPWTPSAGEYSWDIYRSDNGAPYAKVTDFVITEHEYTDHYVFVGRTYLYKLVSYDRSGKPLAVSDPIMVTLVPLGQGGSSGNNPPAGNPGAPASKRIVLQLGNTTAYVNDKAHKLEVAPFNYNGRTVLPLRFVGEALGLDVKWNGQTRSITLRSDKDTIVLVLDDSQATVNGQRVMMDVPAFIHNKVTMVPIRFVSEQLKQKITFDNATKKITIEGQSAAGSSSSSGSSGGGSQSSSGSGSQSSSSGASGGEKQPADSGASYFIGSWSMWVPAGRDGADGGTLTIHADGTFSYRWNGAKSGTWSYDKATGKLLLSGYKSGWDWTVTRTDKGITVSTLGVYETGVRVK